ncbi:hypothetical protein Aperf_G00000098284 [Anoplocephala perfoliata]
MDIERLFRYNDLCPLNRTENRTYFALVIAANHLISTYAIALSVGYLVKMINIKTPGSGLIQRWSISCTLAGILPIIMQNLTQILQILYLCGVSGTYFKNFGLIQPLTLTTQFIRNWMYVNSACVEFYLSKDNVTFDAICGLRKFFLAQVLITISVGVFFLVFMVKLFSFKVLVCGEPFDDLPIFFVITESSEGLSKTITVLTFIHVPPALILIALRATIVHVLTLPSSDKSLARRWSFITTQMHSVVAIGGLTVGIVISELFTSDLRSWALESQMIFDALLMGLCCQRVIRTEDEKDAHILDKG